MAYKPFDDRSVRDYALDQRDSDKDRLVLEHQEGNSALDLPASAYVQDAAISREGMDLVLDTPEGTVVVQGYFAAEHPPMLVSPDGMTLTPELVQSFIRSESQYASAGNNANDASPVGAVQEITGQATVTRLDGTIETIGIGTPIYQGDVIETDDDGAVNIMFVDETTFAVSEDARLAIDEYVFDPATQSGVTNFSVLKGVFVFTSGLIGRDDPDDVKISTPSGSIGIRGTIIAGNVDTGEITVIEGAIVLHDFSGNSTTLSTQYETARFNSSGQSIDHLGNANASDIASKFMSISTVAADLFSSIQDNARESNEKAGDRTESKGTTQETSPTNEPEATPEQSSEVITSEEIISAGTTILPVISTSALSQTAVQTTSVSTSTNTLAAEPAPIIVKPDIQTPFSLEIIKSSVPENTDGLRVATVKGMFAKGMNLALNGVSQNFYEVVRVDAVSFDVRLKTNISVNYEHLPKLDITATNLAGVSITQQIEIAAVNMDEALVATDASADIYGAQNTFAASEGNFWSHSFSNDFSDPEGVVSYSYQFLNASSNPITNMTAYGIPAGGIIFNPTTGQMSLLFSGTVTDANFYIQVTANSGSQTLQETFHFETFAQDILTDYGGGTFMPANGDVFSSGGAIDETIILSDDNVRMFTAGGNDSISIDGNSNYLKAGYGDDTIDVNSGTSNIAFGDDGNDVFNLGVTNGAFYGESGNDRFNASLSDVQGMTGGGRIDGGSGFDLLALYGGGNINFGSLSPSVLTNLERISTNNAAANTITLTYENVINMTDSRNTLIIEMDGNDTLNFVNTSPNQFFNVGQDGDGYAIYTDGVITLLVDNDHAALSGLAN